MVFVRVWSVIYVFNFEICKLHYADFCEYIRWYIINSYTMTMVFSFILNSRSIRMNINTIDTSFDIL